MSEYESKEVLLLIDEIYIQCGGGLEYEECLAEGWVTYIEARQIISVSCKHFWQLIANEIIERFAEMRRTRNRKISVESRLSLDQNIGDSKEDIRSILFPVQGDFTNGVILWQYAKSLGEKKYQMMQYMSQGEEDEYIMDKLRMTSDFYYELKEELKTDMLVYIDEQL